MPYCADIFYRFYDGKKGKFGYPLILIHGIGGTHMSWPAVFRRLSSQNVYAVDLPGHGKSMNPACTSMNGLLSHLMDFINCMGFYHVLLVGFSLGGALALEYTKAFPERVKGLVAISCASRFDIPEEIINYSHSPAKVSKAAEIFSEAAFHPLFPPANRRKILEPLSSMDAAVLKADFHITRDFRFTMPQQPLEIPFLIIGGENDQITPPRCLWPLKSISTFAETAIIPHAGHMVIYEKTEQVMDCLLGFLGNRRFL